MCTYFSRRCDVVDKERGLVGLNKPMNMKARKRKKIEDYGKKLMLSEWFTKVPNDLECNWIVKLSPKGARSIIVATTVRSSIKIT